MSARGPDTPPFSTPPFSTPTTEGEEEPTLLTPERPLGRPEAPRAPLPPSTTPLSSPPDMRGALEGYQLGRRLGRGGYGEVYEAYDRQLDRPVAVKFLTRERASARALARFQDEGRLLARIQHPKIIQIYQAGVSEDGRPFLVMERFGAGSLSAQLTPLVPAPLSLTISVIDQLLEALEAAHALGICHRDVKESNLLFEPQGAQLKLCDFGIARAQGPPPEEASATGEGWVGTRAYLSPERLMGEASRDDPRSDLYAVGVIFYRLLTGERPFERAGLRPSIERQLYLSLHEPPPLPQGCPRAIARCCLELLAPEPAHRPQSARAARASLNEALTAVETASARGERARPKGPQPARAEIAPKPLHIEGLGRRRPRLQRRAIGLVTAALCAGVLLYFTSQGEAPGEAPAERPRGPNEALSRPQNTSTATRSTESPPAPPSPTPARASGEAARAGQRAPLESAPVEREREALLESPPASPSAGHRQGAQPPPTSSRALERRRSRRRRRRPRPRPEASRASPAEEVFILPEANR